MEYLVLDTESCTGRADDCSLCSIGYTICDENFNLIKQEDILVNPMPKKFLIGSKKSIIKTGVTFAYEVDEFRKAPRFNLIYEKIKELFSGRIVLGFSLANDIKYINNACDYFKLERICYEFYDIQFIYQLLHPEEKAVGLKTLNQKYGIEYIEHRSDEDAFGSVILLKKFLEEEKLSFLEVIDKYKIHNGKNTLKGYHTSYSEAIIDELYGLKRSKRIQGEILHNHLRNLSKISNPKEIFCFSNKIERVDVNFIRTLIDVAYEKGYLFINILDFLLNPNSLDL